MTIESIPKLTPPAAKIWKRMPPERRQRMLSSVWCVDCCHTVTITNFTGVVKGGDLLLVGLCSECRHGVARLIETG